MPDWMSRLVAGFRRRMSRRRRDAELNEEFEFHLNRETHERLKAGLPPERAHLAALRAMGPIEKCKEECRDLRRGRSIGTLAGHALEDGRFALRVFRRHPLPASVVIAGLAVAIGAATAVFSLVNASLLRPYAMDDPSSVVGVARAGHPLWTGLPYSDFLRLHQSTQADVEAALPSRVPFSRSRTDEASADRPILFVSGGYLSLLGGRPELGRTLVASDDGANAPPVIVVSHHLWTTALGSDRGLIGKTVWVNGAPVTLVGVVRPEFTGPVRTPVAIWAPISAFDDVGLGPAITRESDASVEIVARLGEARDRLAVQARMRTLLAHPDEASSQRPRGAPLELRRATAPIDDASPDDVLALACIFGTVGLVLALACGNTANLLLASARTRVREIGVRLALGATRGRLIRQMLMESLLLSAAAGVAGFVLALWLVPVLSASVELPGELNLSPDLRVLLFTTVLVAACGLAAGMGPARHGAGGRVLAALQAQAGSHGRAAIRSRGRAWFIGFQTAVSVLLLVFASLLARTATVMTSVEPGFDADRLLIVSFEPLRADLEQPDFLERVTTAVRAVPGVDAVSATEYEPFGRSRSIERFVHEGRSFELRIDYSDANVFRATGVRILRGRALNQEEVDREAPVAVISAAVARTFFGSADPIGRPLSTVPSAGGRPQAPATIVGVAADALLDRPEGQTFGTIYRPRRREPERGISDQRFRIPLSLLVRVNDRTSGPREVEAAIQRVETGVRPSAQFASERLDRYLESKRRMAWLIGPVALLALVLAALGVYGVTAFVVSQRLDEVSVRMALGASAADVRRMLMTDGLRPVVIGSGIGLSVAMAASSVAAGAFMLSGISSRDPASIGVATVTVFACALVAVLIPARRAARTDPARLMREA